MDPASLIGLLIVLAVAAAAWSRPTEPVDPSVAPPAHRVVVEELDDEGRVTRRVVL